MCISCETIVFTTSITATYASPTATLQLSANVIAVGQTITATAINAHDLDTDQVGSGIVSYQWGLLPVEIGESGAVVQALPDQASVTIDWGNVSAGTYILSLSVEDDEGNWSEPVTTTLQVLAHKIYLPIIIR